MFIRATRYKHLYFYQPVYRKDETINLETVANAKVGTLIFISYIQQCLDV